MKRLNNIWDKLRSKLRAGLRASGASRTGNQGNAPTGWASQAPRGCGAMSGWLSWIKPPHHEFFHTACVLHDELYLLGGSEADRKRADERLYEDMVRHSLAYFAKRGMTHSQAWFLTLAYLYYLAVRLFGRSQFNYHKGQSKQATEADVPPVYDQCHEVDENFDKQ